MQKSADPLTSENQATTDNILGVIPCFNVGDACAPVVEGVNRYLAHVVAVDDGSTDDTSLHLRGSGAKILRHQENRGKGVALLTAFRYALDRGYHAVLTVDGDGQHHPDDIPALVDEYQREAADLLVGVRDIRWGVAPLRNWLGNSLSGQAFSWISRTQIRDCQSGFRVYSAEFLRRVLPCLDSGRYETEMKLLLYAAKNGFRLRWAPIRTIYDEKARRLSHFDPWLDTVRVVGAMAQGIWGYGLGTKG